MTSDDIRAMTAPNEPDDHGDVMHLVNAREVADSVDVFRTAGNRIGITVSVYGDGWRTTYLTPREWYAFLASGNEVAAMVTNYTVETEGSGDDE